MSMPKKLPILIGESGGTKTDWCFIDSNECENYFEGPSYHPDNWNDQFENELIDFWKEKSSCVNAQVVLFSAGCYKDENAKMLSGYLDEIFHQGVIVKSDLHAATIASLGSGAGTAIILGTGSVLINWDGHEIESISGGKGHQSGDQGSGFYFGKLAFEAYQNDELSENQYQTFHDRVDMDTLIGQVENGEDKAAFSHLSFKLRECNGIFENIHRENLHEFAKKYLKNAGHINVSLIGGYGFSQQKAVVDVFSQYGVRITDFINRPLKRLIEQRDLFID
jgi:N-acetylglucosamine kinase-like BadF-type ATPase